MPGRCARNCIVPRSDKVCHLPKALADIASSVGYVIGEAGGQSGGDRLFGTVVALCRFVSNDRMRSRVLKGAMLAVSTTLMASAFVQVHAQSTPRSLMLLGAGLVSLATLSRWHFADEK